MKRKQLNNNQGKPHNKQASQFTKNPKNTQQIWSEERENIYKFWLSLADRNRTPMLIVNKADLLQRMKDQSKQNLCTCDACVRRGYFNFLIFFIFDEF